MFALACIIYYLSHHLISSLDKLVSRHYICVNELLHLDFTISIYVDLRKDFIDTFFQLSLVVDTLLISEEITELVRRDLTIVINIDLSKLFLQFLDHVKVKVDFSDLLGQSLWIGESVLHIRVFCQWVLII